MIYVMFFFGILNVNMEFATTDTCVPTYDLPVEIKLSSIVSFLMQI